MTNEELIAEARKAFKRNERHAEAGLTLEMLPKIAIVDSAVVYFTSDEHSGKVEVFLERDTGKVITMNILPSKQ